MRGGLAAAFCAAALAVLALPARADPAACASAEAAYRLTQVKLAYLPIRRYLARTPADKHLAIAEMQMEISAASLALQYMSMAGCKAPSLSPDTDPVSDLVSTCAAKTIGARSVNPDAPFDCPEIRAYQNKIRTGTR